MCVTSFVGDVYRDRWIERYPQTIPQVTTTGTFVYTGIGREEFDALKREVEEMKELLIAAKRYDEEHGEPDCEMDDKVALLKRVADAVGVDLSEVFG